jgi:acetolactate synthase small subunit
MVKITFGESISKVVQVLVDNDLSLQDALQKDYGNYSAVARMLRPRIREILGRDVKLESIITAVRRAKAGSKQPARDVVGVVAGSVVNIRTDVAKVSAEKTQENLERIRRKLATFSGEFFHVSEGMSAITLIFDQRLFGEIRSMFSSKGILNERQGLAAIILHSPIEIISTPGCLQLFIGTVSRRYVNIEEAMSCFTDTIIVVSMNDVSKAFAALADLVAETRKQLS